ncbi:MAG: hypothetical protein M3Z11_04585 [Candidatus Dormibacteraeota bacterium]|nr:hypothetical protein [Candidatus Dormibacteraeota bacterium]
MSSHEGSRSVGELAEGEDPLTTSSREIERWVSVYTELIKFETDLINEVTVRISTMSPEARRETERTDLPALQKDAERFGARLAFWRERSAQLKRKE